MGKPTYEELADFIHRLSDIDCDQLHPKNCEGCILLYTGFCKEAERLEDRLAQESEIR